MLGSWPAIFGSSPTGHETARQDGPDSRPDNTTALVARLEDEVRFLRGQLERKDTIILALVQRPLARLQTAHRAVAEGPSAPFLAAQFLVAVYGGYFGAGIGILMLAALGLMGLTNIHRMNGLKNWGGMCINGVAVVMFAAGGIIHWPIALTMAAGGVIGGYAGARLAQRVGQERVRGAIVAIGLAAFIWLLYHH